MFKKYVAMDRHGADLMGELYGDEDQEGSGRGEENHDGRRAIKKAHEKAHDADS